MELEGRVEMIGAVQQVSTTFKKRELVIMTKGQYPEPIIIEFIQDKTDLINNLKIGDNVKVSVNIGGREWVNPQGETKYFNSIRGWKINADNQAPAQAQQAPSFEPATDINNQEHDDLPF